MQLLPYLFWRILQGKSFDYTHFMEEETGAQQLGNLPKVIQLVNYGAKIKTQASGFRVCAEKARSWMGRMTRGKCIEGASKDG